MRSFACLLAVVLATFSVASAYTIAGCGIGNLDFSSFTNYQMVYNTASWTYVFRMCGIVRDSLCSQDTTTIGSMLCQRTNSTSSDFYDLMTWGEAAGTWGSDNGDITYQLATGEECAAVGAQRSTTVRFQCLSSATTPYISSITEPSTCQYVVYVQTSFVCEAACTYLGVDVSTVNPNGADLSWTSTNGQYNWYVNLCSRVVNSACEADSTANSSMVCQSQVTGGTDSFAIANYASNAVTWSVVTSGASAGLLATTNNGEYCAAILANRATRIQLICDASLAASASYISGITETTTCNYQVTIFTSATCPFVVSSTGPAATTTSSSWWPATATNCSFTAYDTGKTFDFGYLWTASDLEYDGFIGSTYYNTFFHMCGIVRNTQCLGDGTTYNSMICQASPTNPNDNYALATYNAAAMIVSEYAYGVQFYQETGEYCGSFKRAVTVQWACQSEYTRDTIISITEGTTCHYTVLIYSSSSVICNGTNELFVSTNDEPLYPNCVYTVGDAKYDFKTINPADGTDLTVYLNPTASNAQNIFIHMCARVSYQKCRSNTASTNAMVCQYDLDVQSAYSLADYDESNMIWGQVSNSQIIRLKMINGELCGSVDRTVTMDFYCNTAYSNATITYFGEQETCQYQISIAANSIMCNFNPNNPDGEGSSSNMNGGMIALIVIVIILGLIVIIGACAAWRFYDRPNSYQKESGYPKNVEMQNAGEGQSYEHEESQSTV